MEKFDDAVYALQQQTNAAYSEHAMANVRYNSYNLPLPPRSPRPVVFQSPAQPRGAAAGAARARSRAGRRRRPRSKKLARRRRASLTKRTLNAYAGIVYDLRHFSELPQKTALGRVRFVATRSGRSPFLLLALWAVVALCYVVCCASRKKK